MKRKLLATTPTNDHPQTYNDRDHHVEATSPLVINDQEIENDIDANVDIDANLPPLPPSFMGDSFVLDHLPENFDFISGQTTDPNHLIMQFEPCETNCVDLIIDSQPNIQFLDVIP